MNMNAPGMLGVESGVVRMFDHFESEGPMWMGSGKRWSRQAVQFSKPFQAAPEIQLSLSMIDADSGRNLRLELISEDVTPEGFTAVAHTWSDTRIGRLSLKWIAMGNRIDTVQTLWNV